MKKIISLLILIIVSTGFVTAQKSEEKSYTLQQCIDIALNQNLDVLSMKAAVEAAQSSVKRAFGAYLPAIQFNMGYSRQLNSDGGRTVNVGGQIIPIGETPPNSYNMSLSAGLNLFDGFSRESNFKYAELTYEKGQLSLEQSKVYVRLGVYQKYFDYLAKKQIVQTRRENLDAGQKELESIKAQEQAGVIPISNVYTKEAELGSLELDLAKAENDVDIARASLLSLMGLNPTEKSEFLLTNIDTDISEGDIKTFRDRFNDLDASVVEALKSRFDYKSQQKTVLAAQANISAARASYFPTLSMGGGWSWSNTEFSGFSEQGRSYIGLNLSLPIFDGFTTNALVQQAEYEYKSQEISTISKEQSIRTEVEQAFLNLDAAAKQISIAEKALYSADMNYKILKERFNVGTANITEVVQANTQYLTSKINQISSIYSYLLAQKVVEYSTGRMN